jgi:hypothetical protein
MHRHLEARDGGPIRPTTPEPFLRTWRGIATTLYIAALIGTASLVIADVTKQKPADEYPNDPNATLVITTGKPKPTPHVVSAWGRYPNLGFMPAELVPVSQVGIIEVKLSGGRLDNLSLLNGTVVDKELDPENKDVLLIAVASGGEKIQSGGCNADHCFYSGVTFWFKVGTETKITNKGSQTLGPDATIDLNIGDTVTQIQSSLSSEENLNSYNTLINSVDHSFPRTDRSFSFTADNLVINA